MRLSLLLFLFQAATRLASVATFVRGMLALLLHTDGISVEQEWWYRKPMTPWGIS